MTAAPSNALVPVEKSAAIALLDERSANLLSLLPDEAAALRFRQIVAQALTKNRDLLDCTPDSVVSAVFDAAAMGLEPTGAAGGAHLVPYSVKVTVNGRETWEKRAQLIPDFRGVIQMVTRPDRTGRPSDVLSIEARVVKEGDDFTWTEGTDAIVEHRPSLAPNRSAKPTTHVYAIARLRNGAALADVMDRSAVERIQNRGKQKAFSPWASDWDEMAKKTVIKRLAKVLPVRPEVRSLLTREDELDEAPPTPAAEVTGSRVARLAARLRPAETAQGPAEATSGTRGQDDDAPLFGAAVASLRDRLLDSFDSIADEALHDRGTNPDEKAQLQALFAPADRAGEAIAKASLEAGLAVTFDRAPADLTGAHAAAILGVAASMGHDAFRAAWRAELG